MADPADDRAVYLEAVRRAEEAAGITRDAEGNEHDSGETPVATPELPEAVPVAASDQPLDPEPAQDADTSEQQPAAPAAVEQPKTVEELQAELARTQARLEEKDNFIGRQSGEVGELRAAIADLKARLDAQAAQPAPQSVTPTVVLSQETIYSDPARAVEIAFQQKDEATLAVAFEAWKDPLNPNGDPFAAATWLAEKRAVAREEALRAEIEATRAEIKNVAAPIAQNTEQAQWEAAFATATRDRPDFLQHAERLLEEVAPKFPTIVAALKTADAKGKAEVLTALYDLDRAQATDPAQTRAELEREAAEAAAEAEAARTAAQVVSQTTAGQPGVEKTQEELEQDAYLSRMGAKPSLSRGWTGRS